MAASPPATSRVVAVDGDAPSRGPGRLSEMEIPVLHNDGAAVFAALLRNNGILVGSGIFRGNGSTRVLDAVVLEGDPAPDGNGRFDTWQDPRVNPRGDTAFGAVLAGTSGGGADRAGYFRVPRAGGPAVKIMRGNDPVPGDNGRFQVLVPTGFGLNGAGQVAFGSSLVGSPQGASAGIFRSDGTNLTRIAQVNDPAPGGGTFSGVNFLTTPPALNEAGEVLFLGEVRITQPSQLITGFYLGAGGTPRKIVARRDPLPDGRGSFNGFITATLNDRGEIAFVDPALLGTDSVTSSGIFRGNGTNMTQIVRSGDFLPGNIGRYLLFDSDLALNNRGQVLFHAAVFGAPGGIDSGLFLADGTNNVTIALANDPAPGGGRFFEFSTSMLALNENGQVAFRATIDLQNGGPRNDIFGLFLWDPADGLIQVAREGDQLPGIGPISRIDFAGGLGPSGDEASGLNDRGVVAYRCFAGANSIIVLWSRGNGGNLPPVSSGLVVETPVGQSLTLTVADLMSVISDPEGGNVTLVSVSNRSARDGTVIHIGGFVQYLPPPNFAGTDSFTYVVRDDGGATLTASVTVNVIAPPTNRPPVLVNPVPPEIQIVPGRILRLTVAELLAVATDPDNDPLMLGPLPERTTNGAALSLQGDILRIDWSETTARSNLMQLGSDRLDYIIHDGRGGSVTARVNFLAADGYEGIEVTPAGIVLKAIAGPGVWAIQRSESVLGPWEDLHTFEIDDTSKARESVEFTDTQPPSGRAFYRVTSEVR